MSSNFKSVTEDDVGVRKYNIIISIVYTQKHLEEHVIFIMNI